MRTYMAEFANVFNSFVTKLVNNLQCRINDVTLDKIFFLILYCLAKYTKPPLIELTW